MLDTAEASVKGALQRARATLRARLPTADRERAPRPNSASERQLVGRFADAVQSGDVDEIVSLLTDDALLTMPPQPLEYQGHDAIAAFLRHRAELRGAPLRVVPTRANTQPAFGCYLPDAHAAIARPYGLIVLTLEADAIAAITWFAGTGVFRQFELPRTLPSL
jgi:RNA polymerase sigma-70 factor (ECF subfamily)